MNPDYLLFSLACSQVTQLNIYVGMFQPQEGFQVTQPGQTHLYMFRGGKNSIIYFDIIHFIEYLLDLNNLLIITAKGPQMRQG